jgi:osmoprotectant transport system ATP-binding protein
VIRLEAVTKRYGDGQVAVRELTLEVPGGELCVLVGPSGCGKTTTMRMINRLIEPTSGRIYLGDEDVTDVNPVVLRRRMGYVIQQVGLFPHQTIAENVATVPKLLGWDRQRVKARVAEMFELVGLDADRFARRYPHELSGGQRQRVGVARALAADPPVLLMDEPFGAIDPVTRNRLQGEFLRLQADVKKTIVFVTHDIEEAVRMGDRIAILSEGGILQQYDTPAQILGAPVNDFVADFVGADRGLKRLQVTPIDLTELEHPPIVTVDDDLATARTELDREKARWAIVLDRHGALHGSLDRNRADGDGVVHERGRRLPAAVPSTASLKQAMSEMLQHDAAWVAVLDGDRYLGVLTPDSLHRALRRSVAAGADAPETEPAER